LRLTNGFARRRQHINASELRIDSIENRENKPIKFERDIYRRPDVPHNLDIDRLLSETNSAGFFFEFDPILTIFNNVSAATLLSLV
jgi:hypothetical protein